VSATKSSQDIAIEYTHRRWRVFPLHSIVEGRCSCPKENCEDPGKHPRTQHGLKDATIDESQIKKWWTKWSPSNIGIRTGKDSGFFILDIDPRHGGDRTLFELEEKHGKLPSTVEAITGGGGRHIYFAYPESFEIKSRNGVFQGIDVKGDGGYVVGVPSLHASGREYAWDIEARPEEVPLAEAPEWLLKILNKHCTGNGKLAPPLPEKLEEGRRSNGLTSLAGSMRRRGASQGAIEAALIEENARRCEPPLTETEVKKIAVSISRYEATAVAATEALPIRHVSEIETVVLEYQVEKILVKNSVAFISGQPGEWKTFLAQELGVSVSSGTLAFGVFATKKGRVVIYNAEDDPASITKIRIEALAKAKGLKLSDLDLHLIDVPSLQIDDLKTQSLFAKTVDTYRPVLLILDPLRMLHSLNEDKASEMSPLLNFLRKIQREFSCSILLVCHDRKPTKDEVRRPSMTRGTNALEGWRDTAIYLDRDGEDRRKVTVYHRGAPAPEPFHFRLVTKNKSGLLVEVRLEHLTEGALRHEERLGHFEKIRAAIAKCGPLTRDEIRKETEIRRSDCLAAVKEMVDLRHELIEKKEGKKTLIQFPEPVGNFSTENRSGTSRELDL